MLPAMMAPADFGRVARNSSCPADFGRASLTVASYF